MSLINQMLSDLDQRQAPLQASNNEFSEEPYITIPINPENTHAHNKVSLLKLSFYLIVITLLAITSYFSYLNYSKNTTDNTSSVATKVTTPIAATTKSTRKIINTPNKKTVTHSAPSRQLEQKKINVTQTTLKVLPTKKIVVATPALQNQPYIANTELNDTIEAEVYNNHSVVKQKIKLKPQQQAELAYKQGYRLLQKNKIYSAEMKLMLALEHNSKHIKAREMLVGLYLKTGRKVEAESLLQTGIILVPDYTQFTKLYARLLLENNQTAKAVKTLLHNKPTMKADLNYHALLAASYQRNKNHAAAATTYLKLLKLEPREGIWWVGMAISLEALNKHKEASEAYEKARQTGTLNTRISNYSTQRLKELSLHFAE